jgi:spermidine synthase
MNEPDGRRPPASAAEPDAPHSPQAAALLPAARLMGISAVCLLVEMALIRFINSTVQVIAYFNNFVILATFLGMGVGALCARRWPRLFAHSAVLLAGVLVGVVALDKLASSGGDQADFVAWFAADDTTLVLPAGVMVSLIFFACFAVFVPLGCELGRCIEAYEDRLQAYGYDVLGSVTGVAVFALASWGRYPPWAWFLIAGVAISLLMRSAGISIVWRAPLLVAAAGITLLVSDGTYSPYYKIQLAAHSQPGAARPTHYSVLVDKVRIQDAIDFDQDLRPAGLASWVPYYELPYRIMPKPRSVLVLGGGSGNDTVFALRSGASRIHTVEIDPILADFGHTVHPQRPYADPRVRAINDDARAFLRGTADEYDLIVMNALDSHHQLPGLSTLRLESYMYTVESFQDVQRHMGPESVFVLHLSSTRPWMGERVYWSLTKAFGREPTLFTTPDSPFGSIAFALGPDHVIRAAQRSSGLLVGRPHLYDSVRATTTLATDDWPHLYLATPRIPRLYYQVLGFIVLLALTCLVGVRKLVRDSGGAAIRPTSSLHFALLGASFMLLETRAITQFALLFGSTWAVSAIVISSILCVIFIANRWLRLRSAMSPELKSSIYASLLAALAGLYFLPLDSLLPLDLFGRVLGAALIVGTPIFAASLIFSDSFRRVSDAAGALGANLMGVVLGGALEYSSMQLGLRSLYLIAAAMYALAWLAERMAMRERISENRLPATISLRRDTR